jgi:hypothetical protein
MSRYQPPETLAARHQLTGFRCRSEEQSAWLVDVAKQAHGTGTTSVFVVAEVDQPHVVAYYAWSIASVASQPITLLARHGVDDRCYTAVIVLRSTRQSRSSDGSPDTVGTLSCIDRIVDASFY